MKRILLLFLCVTSMAQSIDVVQTTTQVNERRWLESARASYDLDETGTNVVLVQINLDVRVDRKIGSGTWEKVSLQPISFTRAGANSWVTSYTNNSGVVVTNSIRTAALSDCDRVELLSVRAAQLIKLPQAMSVNP